MINLCIYTSSWYLFVLALIYPIINHYMIVFLLEYSAKKKSHYINENLHGNVLNCYQNVKMHFFFLFCSDFNLSYN